MNTTLYLCAFLLLVIALTSWRQQRIRNTIRRRRRTRRNHKMNELIQRFLGKTCTIYMGSFGGDLVGTIEAVEGNWVSVRTKKTTELINLDYICRLREVPAK